MKLRYDAQVDALSIIFRETTVTTRTLTEGSTPDYARTGGWPGSKSSMPGRALAERKAFNRWKSRSARFGEADPRRVNNPFLRLRGAGR